MRRKIVAGNWKMNKNKEEAIHFMDALRKAELREDIDIVLCPNYLALEGMRSLDKDNIYTIAQNFHEEKSGAYTGEVSLDMLKGIGVDGSLIGHSERRKYFNETDDVVAKKVARAKEENFYSIICVGEVLEEREQGKAKDVVKRQVTAALKPLNKEDLVKVTLAYEPVWAIGTGKTATSEDAQDMCAYIREVLKDMFGEESANLTRILYGGSVKPNNINGLMSQKDIDGVLVGGASLEVESFLQLINFDACGCKCECANE